MQSQSATAKILTAPNTEDLVRPIPDDWLNWHKRSNGDWELTTRAKAERDKQAGKVSQSYAGKRPKQRRGRHDAAD